MIESTEIVHLSPQTPTENEDGSSQQPVFDESTFETSVEADFNEQSQSTSRRALFNQHSQSPKPKKPKVDPPLTPSKVSKPSSSVLLEAMVSNVSPLKNKRYVGELVDKTNAISFVGFDQHTQPRSKQCTSRRFRYCYVIVTFRLTSIPRSLRSLLKATLRLKFLRQPLTSRTRKKWVHPPYNLPIYETCPSTQK